MLTDLVNAIIARLTADVAGLNTCAAYPKTQRSIKLPAVLLDLDELDPDDFGSDKFDCMARFTAYCIVDPVSVDADLAVRNLAAMVAVRVSQEADFNFSVEKRAEVTRVGEDFFKPDLDGYLVWAVEFQIGLALGEDVWAGTPAVGVDVATVTVGGLDTVEITKLINNVDEPATADTVTLPIQPKG